MGKKSVFCWLTKRRKSKGKTIQESTSKNEGNRLVIDSKETADQRNTDRNNNILTNGFMRSIIVVFSKKNKIKKVDEKSKIEKKNSFIIHGIDYLPEAMKKKERKKKNIPKFLELPNLQPVFSIFQNHESRPSTSNFSLKNNSSKKVSLSNSSTNSPEIISDERWKMYKGFPFRNIVMSGGGSKGYAYIGSLKALEDCGLLKDVKRLAGSSAGAICAGLLAVGCSPQEIADVFKCDIKWLFHDQRCVCCCLPGMYSEYGVHPAKRFHKIYGQHLRRKAGSADITFKQVYEKLGVELCVVVTNLSRMCSEYCSHLTVPDLPIRDAIRMSMSFPVMYRAVRAAISGRECLYTDGGLLDQYPISYFDDESRFGESSHFDIGSDVSKDDELLFRKSTVSETHQKDEEEEDDDDAVAGGDMKMEGDLDDERDKRKEGEDGGAGVIEGQEADVKKNKLNYETLGLYVVSERAVDHKIWRALFDCHIPYRPTYLPNTKLARARLKNEMSIRKLHDKQFNKQEFMEDLAMTEDLRQHYELIHKSHVDIRSLSEYFMTAIEALLISQRKVRVRKKDKQRTVAINCGYIGTNDYEIEPPDREFMIDQGYSCTVKYLKDFIKDSDY